MTVWFFRLLKTTVGERRQHSNAQAQQSNAQAQQSNAQAQQSRSIERVGGIASGTIAERVYRAESTA